MGTENGREDVIAKVHHSSFEVHDLDTQNIGHQHLEDAGWTNAWGVGRHFLGSQIFDYWYASRPLDVLLPKSIKY